MGSQSKKKSKRFSAKKTLILLVKTLQENIGKNESTSRIKMTIKY
jgi:hypothetical protein